MAQLKSGSTVGGVTIAYFSAGTKMLFNQTSAPTGWTKQTSQNDKALRVVSGTVGTGGTHGLSSPPSTSHTHTGPSHTHSTPSHSHSHSLSAGSHTLSTSQMPSHNHSMPGGGLSGGGTKFRGYPGSGWPDGPTSSTGGSGSHSHSLSGSITSGGSGTSGSGGTGATSSSGPTAFAPAYVDVIIATKD